MVELTELTEKGWIKTDEGCDEDPLLERGNERLLYDTENKRIVVKYIKEK